MKASLSRVRRTLLNKYKLDLKKSYPLSLNLAPSKRNALAYKNTLYN